MESESTDVATRTHESFAFTVDGPVGEVAPLFGAAKEKLWAPGWEPHFISPAEPRDEEGMVFTIAHPHGRAVWVNTRFDLAAGEVQYVYVLPEVMTTRITLRIRPAGAQRTRVRVDYERTALRDQAVAIVHHAAAADAAAGPEWKEQIDRYLESARARK